MRLNADDILADNMSTEITGGVSARQDIYINKKFLDKQISPVTSTLRLLVR